MRILLTMKWYLKKQVQSQISGMTYLYCHVLELYGFSVFEIYFVNLMIVFLFKFGDVSDTT